jgi:hypothetical protein
MPNLPYNSSHLFIFLSFYLIPMHGKRIRLYYRGIIKRCTNCFGAHQRKNCKEEKVPWIKYVEQFITNFPEIPKESYGRWANMIDGMSPTIEGNKTIVPEQERESTSMGVNSQQPTSGTSSGIKSKESKLATQTAGRDGYETENEEEQGTEDVRKLREALAKAGISTEDVLKMIMGKKKAANQRQKNVGAGRGRGGKTKK